MRGATPNAGKLSAEIRISIHAPRERSDDIAKTFKRMDVISIHAPRERSDAIEYGFTSESKKFQSTLLVRGATSPPFCILDAFDFNPRSS